MQFVKQGLDAENQAPAAARIAARGLVWFVTALAAGGILALASSGTVRGEALYDDPFFFVKRQLVWLGMGIVAAFLTSKWDYRRWRSTACPVGLLSVALLILVLIVGRRINGCRRWLELGPITFQPSEFAKFATVLMLAYWFACVPLRAGCLKEGLIIPGLGLGSVLILVLLEPDFGTTALIAAVGWIILFLAGADKRWLVGVAVAGVVLLFLYVRFDPHRWELVLAWWDPEGHPELAHHALQAKKAYMLGGGTGVGYMNSMQKNLYLPEVHTDFILPIVGEELGLVGTLSVVALFAGFFVCGAVISLQVQDLFGRLLGFGITTLITLQAVFNICVVTGVLPTKGLALPFFSYGGSNLLMTLMECGILMNMGRGASRRKAQTGMKPIPATLLFAVTMLTILGLTMSYSLDGVGGCSVGRQLVWAMLGFAGLLLVARSDYRSWRTIATPLLVCVLVLLVLGAIPRLGQALHGAGRRAALDSRSAMPWALAKMAMILSLAQFLTRRHGRGVRAVLYHWLVPILTTGILMGLVVVVKDLSAAMLLGLVGIVMIFGRDQPTLCALTCAMVLCALMLHFYPEPQHLPCVLNFLWGPRPVSPPEAISSGGWCGLGLGGGRLRADFPAKAPCDFAIAVLGEELGWCALGVMLAAFIALIGAGFLVSIRVRDRFGSLLGMGIVSLIAFQLILDLARLIGLISLRTVSLPYVSYGGLDLFLMLIGAGLLLSIALATDRDTDSKWERSGPPHPWVTDHPTII